MDECFAVRGYFALVSSPVMSGSVCIASDVLGNLASEAEDFIRKQNWPIDDSFEISKNFAFQLFFKDGALQLRDLNLQNFVFSFEQRKFTANGIKSFSKSHPFRKALGKKSRSVCDATAGFGEDAYLMAALGFHVIAFERDPLIYMLCLNAYLSSEARKKNWPLEFNFADSKDYFEKNESVADIIYLDPMFATAQKKSSALPKKKAQFLRSLVEPEDSIEKSLEQINLAIAKANERVVVKRSPQAEALGGLKPHSTFAAKAVRYDVYFVKS